MRMHALAIAPIALAASAALAGTYDQPYSIIDTEGFGTTDMRMAPVVVSKVDGVPTVDGRAVVAPGRHTVVLTLGVKPTTAMPDQRTIQVEIKPCYRYVFRATLETAPGQEWMPKIQRKVPLFECREKFGLQKPKFTGPPTS